MLKIVENLWAVGAPPRISLGELTDPVAGGDRVCCFLLKNPSASIFGPSVLIRSLSQQSSFPPILRVSIKRWQYPFSEPRMHRNAIFCIKNIFLNTLESRPPDPAAEGETSSPTHPVLTRQVLVPLRFF